MKKVILGFAAILLAVVSIGCSKNSSPKDVVNTYYQAMNSKDYKKAADCFYFEGTQDEIKAKKGELIELMTEKGEKSMEEKGGMKSLKINSVEEEGDSAIVKGVITYGNGEEKEEVINTKKIDGNWYIDLGK